MIRRLSHLRRDARGTAMIEFTLIAMLLMIVTCGTVDFMLALMQYDKASKAAELGARLAVTSNPICGSIAGLTQGSPISCTGNATAPIVYGLGQGTTCPASVPTGQRAAMCSIYNKTNLHNNVTVTYSYSGLGFAGRKDGPVPTVTVELTGLNFNFYFLNGLLGLSPMAMPKMSTTVTGEDLSTAGS